MQIKLLCQVEGSTEILVADVEAGLSLREALAALGAGAQLEAELLTFLEGGEEPIELEQLLEELLIADAETILRIHRCRCHRIETTVRFNHLTVSHRFSPATTIHRIHHWATHELGMSARDAAEHVLQLAGTTTRPDRDTHLGSLVAGGVCAVAFDLVPFKRVEG